MIIDAHVNITDSGKWFNTNHDASLERLLGEMDESGIEKCLLISMPNATNNKYIASVIEKYPEKFRGLGYIDFTKNNLIKQIDEILSMGLSGIKIHPRFQNINPFSKELEYIWDYINNKQLTLMICGYLQISNSNLLIRDIEPLSYEKNLKKYNNTNLILSHAGCHKIFDTYFLIRSNKNFYTDISFIINYFKGTSFYADIKFILKHADQKVLFGSDFPEFSLIETKNNMSELLKDIPNDKISNVLYKNAHKLFWKV